MKKEVINIDDLSDSKELLMQSAPPFLLGCICFILVVFILAYALMSYFVVDCYFAAPAEIRTESSYSTLTAISGGEVNNVFYHDGDYVETGSTILTFNNDQLITNRKSLEKQKEENETYIQDCELLVQSIQEDYNYFSEEDKPLFYYQYEDYRLSSEYGYAVIQTKNDGISDSKSAIDSAIKSTQDTIDNINAEISEYEALYKAISDNDIDFVSDNAAIQNYFNNYLALYTAANTKLSEYQSKYDNLLAQQSISPESVSEEDISQAYTLVTNTETEIDDLRVSAQLEVSECIQSLSSQGKSYESAVNDYKVQKDALQYDNTGTISNDKLKNQYFISIYKNIDTVNKENENLTSQIEALDRKIDNMDVVATQAGILLFTNDIVIGDVIASGSIVATILPNGSSLKATVYIPEKYIAEVSVGGKIEFTFEGLSTYNFGSVTGQIQRIAADSIYDSASQQKFYKVDASIDNCCLVGKDGSIVNLKIGMNSEAHVITGEQKVIDWVMEKLDFKS